MNNHEIIFKCSGMGLLLFSPFACLGNGLPPVIRMIGMGGFIICVSIVLSYILWVQYNSGS
jgi:hypothetical protein